MSNELTKTNQLPTITSKLSLEEKYFLQLNEKHTIDQYDKLNIKDANAGYSGAELARYHIGNNLETFYGIVGLPKERWPSKELSKTISKFIQKTYGYIAPVEIIDAVEMALQGRFVVNLEHHGTMDLIYINEILAAYSKYRYQKKGELEKKLESKHMTKEEFVQKLIKSDEVIKDMIITSFNNHKDKKDNPYDLIMAGWFEWLVEIGFMKYETEWLRDKYRTIKSQNHEWSELMWENQVKLLAIRKAFDEKIEKMDTDNPFKCFEFVCYLDLNPVKQHAKSIANELAKKFKT
jgi:hypothetical protein